MIIIVSSKIGRDSINASLGKPEYSYYFLLKEFLPAIKQIGTLVEASTPDEVDALYDQYRSQGEDVIFLSFSPPQQTPVELRCPTLPVFAWEFNNTPDQAWDGDLRNNWQYVFSRVAGAIATSSEAAEAVQRLMGPTFNVAAIPAPIWDRFQDYCPADGWNPELTRHTFSFLGKVIDSPVLGLSADGLARKPIETENDELLKDTAESEQPGDNMPKTLSRWDRWLTTKALAKGWYQEVSALLGHGKSEATIDEVPPSSCVETEPESEPTPEPGAPVPPKEIPHELTLEGVIYTSVLNPGDSRKNIIDMITAFCWAFKQQPQATLILKMTHHDIESYRILMLTLLSRLAPFECRVVIVHGFLDDAQYRQLMDMTSYYVNTSTCEGLCLPLMEFLSAGKPAIAPSHTAMRDYMADDFAWVLKSSQQPASWPHDPTAMLATRLHRLNWGSLVSSYEESFRVATEQPERYRAMSLRARKALGQYASLNRVCEQLKTFLLNVMAPQSDLKTDTEGAP